MSCDIFGPFFVTMAGYVYKDLTEKDLLEVINNPKFAEALSVFKSEDDESTDEEFELFDERVNEYLVEHLKKYDDKLFYHTKYINDKECYLFFGKVIFFGNDNERDDFSLTDMNELNKIKELLISTGFPDDDDEFVVSSLIFEP